METSSLGYKQKRILNIKASEKERNLRVDVFLSNKDIGLSRSQIKKIIDEGYVLSGKHSLKAKHRVRDGEEIEVIIPPVKKLDLDGENIPLDIVYEDDSVIVINKPAGIVVHPAAGNYSGTLVHALLFHCKDLSGIGGVERPGIVHRLDKDTSGLLMVAKNDFSHKEITEQLQSKTISRKYIAIVCGIIKEGHGTIDREIGRHVKDRKKMSTITCKGREAVTHFRVIKRFSEASLVELSLETGRTHQIRVHLSSMGYPVLGDKVYCGKRALKSGFLINRQALHAASLGFNHPTTGKYIEFNAPLPRDMQEAINKLKAASLKDNSPS